MQKRANSEMDLSLCKC